MKKPMLTILLFLLSIAVVYADSGLQHVKSVHPVDVTADRLVSVLAEKGMTVFARINHAAGAEKAGIDLPATELVIFGNPKVGSPLMKCDRSVGIDLPQKALVWEDENGQVWLSYNDPQYLAGRHDLSGCMEVIKKVENALAGFAKVATSP